MTDQDNVTTTFKVNGTSFTMPFIRYCEMIADLENNPPEDTKAYEAAVKTYIPG
jgi:hypothetical protein